jgi:hypothetical protein
MSHAIRFDTHQYARKLKDAGFSESQVDNLLDLATASGRDDVATKTDLEPLATKAELRELELRMTIKLGGIVVAAVAAMSVIMRFLPAGH